MAQGQENHEQVVHKTQAALWLIQCELKSYAFLLSSLSAGIEVGDGDLYGLGHRLDWLQARLEKINDRLSGLLPKS